MGSGFPLVMVGLYIIFVNHKIMFTHDLMGSGSLVMVDLDRIFVNHKTLFTHDLNAGPGSPRDGGFV